MVDELQALKTFDVVGVVAVDDMWCFDGKNGYPTIDELTKLIVKLWPQAKPTREDEVMWFTTV